jgi:hypothetical protein
MSKIEWRIRFLLRMWRHTERLYYYGFGWHAYTNGPEFAADTLVKEIVS